MKNKKFFEAIAVLIGTIVGAGIFGLPYAFNKSGFMVGLFYLIILGGVFLITSFCYGEIVLRTKDQLEMSGYTERYLGKKGKVVMTISLIFGIYAALVAYIIGVGQFLQAILGPILGGSQFFWSLIFWACVSLIVLKGIGIVSKMELFMTCGLIFIALFIFIFSFPYIHLDNLKTFHPTNLFFPYGIVLFALGGATAIPTMRRLLNEKTKWLKPTIFLGHLIPIVVYIIFTFAVIGVCGKDTSETAILGLAAKTSNLILLVCGIFGVLAISTSFLSLSHVLKEVFHRDHKIPVLSSWGLTVFIPLILFLFGLNSFVSVIGFSGGILAGVQSIILIMAFYKAKKMGDRTPEYNFNLAKPLACLICLMFVGGIIYQIIYH